MLNYLKLSEVGPSPHMRVDFAPRLNLLAGDNGLGKTFMLDIAWWAVSATWAGLPALPDPQAKSPTIEFSSTGLLKAGSVYSFDTQTWGKIPHESPLMAIYVRADGGISVLDPIKSPKPIMFQPDQIWNGLRPGLLPICNGLIADWVSWQQRKSKQKHDPFEIIIEVLKELSASESERLVPGEPRRISLIDAREIPTLKFPYGVTPVTHASAGVRRVLALAYILVWMWSENISASKLTRKAPIDRMIVLFDEVEAHLHPQWQRRLLPSLLKVISKLHPNVDVQLIASTHSPMVLASVETLFDETRDALTVFDLKAGKVRARRDDWRMRGDASSWLTSDIFGLDEARSVEAERAIKKALKAVDKPEMDVRKLHSIHTQLRSVLKDTDPFWPRWQYYAERKGLSL